MSRAKYASQLAEWRSITAQSMTGDRDEEEFRRDARVDLAARAMEPARGGSNGRSARSPPGPAEAAAMARTQRRSYRLRRIWVARIWRRLIGARPG